MSGRSGPVNSGALIVLEELGRRKAAERCMRPSQIAPPTADSARFCCDQLFDRAVLQRKVVNDALRPGVLVLERPATSDLAALPAAVLGLRDR
jgi:hypothetical protein